MILILVGLILIILLKGPDLSVKNILFFSSSLSAKDLFDVGVVIQEERTGPLISIKLPVQALSLPGAWSLRHLHFATWLCGCPGDARRKERQKDYISQKPTRLACHGTACCWCAPGRSVPSRVLSRFPVLIPAPASPHRHLWGRSSAGAGAAERRNHGGLSRRRAHRGRCAPALPLPCRPPARPPRLEGESAPLTQVGFPGVAPPRGD